MSETVQATDGAMLPLESLAQEFIFSGSFLSTITVVYQGRTYVQTFLNDGTNITYISNWIYNATPPGSEIMVDENGEVMTEEDGTTIMVTEA
jgi:hypothetical protein